MTEFRGTCLQLLLLLLLYLPLRKSTNNVDPNYSNHTSIGNSKRQKAPAEKAKLFFPAYSDPVSRLPSSSNRATRYIQELVQTEDHLVNRKKTAQGTISKDANGNIVWKIGKTLSKYLDYRYETSNWSKDLSGKLANDRTKRSLVNNFDSSSTIFTGTTERNINDELLQNDTCQLFGTCEVASKKTVKFCSCDQSCSSYNDCCLDADFKTTNSEYKFHCEAMTSYANYFGVQIVKECPQHVSGSVINRKCQDSYIPKVGPWVIDDEGVVYQNKYCAQCFDQTNFKEFVLNMTMCKPQVVKDLQTKPNLTTDMILYILFTGCTLIDQIPPEGSVVRLCLLFDKVFASKNDDCKTRGYNPVIAYESSLAAMGSLYKNKFCVPESRKNWIIKCVAQSDILNEEENNQTPNMLPLSILFSSDGCRNENDRLCQENELMIAHAPIEVWFDLVLPRNWTLQQKLQISHALLVSFPNQVNFQIASCFMHKDTENITCQIIIILEQVLKQSSLLEYQSRFLNYKWQNIISMADGSVVKVYIIPMTDHNPANLIKVSTMQAEYKSEHVLINSTKTEYTCLSQLLESKMINETLVVKTIKCLENTVDYIKKEPSNINKIILTYFGMVSSVLALLISLVIYRKTAMCDSVPGSNIENISISLLLFSVMFLVGVEAVDYSVVCFTVGVVLHYTWMTMFAFKSITLIHICFNLTKFSNMTNNEIQVKRRNCTILGLILPLPLIVPAVLLDIFDFSGFQVHYGGSVCFPNGYPGNLTFVFGPIGLSVLTNIICFLCVFVIITKQSFDSRNIRKTCSYKHLPILVRLGAVTGIFWITGVIWALFPSELLEYIFLVSCSFQGLFVAISNLSTKKYISYIRDKISR